MGRAVGAFSLHCSITATLLGVPVALAFSSSARARSRGRKRVQVRAKTACARSAPRGVTKQTVSHQYRRLGGRRGVPAAFRFQCGADAASACPAGHTAGWGCDAGASHRQSRQSRQARQYRGSRTRTRTRKRPAPRPALPGHSRCTGSPCPVTRQSVGTKCGDEA